ncbi:MAG: prepilin-type N-terminal cleavage/methylation domain-containing protein [Nitrospirae bacterium]|nr:prepilin-type N-terminal cleavage/methylation domain-containing protein [Nitrospirota bacterium]
MRRQKTEVRRQKTEKGFTLVEVMVALVVLLVGMLGVIGMQYYAVTGNAFSREMRIATSLGEDLVEQMDAMPYLKPDGTLNLASGTDTPKPPDPNDEAGRIALLGKKSSENAELFTRTWWVVPDCVSLDLTNDDPNDPCNRAIATACSATGDPDPVRNVPVCAIRARTCWTDPKSGTIHSVTLDTLRWRENAIP